MIDSVTDQIVKQDFKNVSGSKCESFTEYKRDINNNMDILFAIWFITVVVIIMGTLAVYGTKLIFIDHNAGIIFLVITTMMYVIGVCFISMILQNKISTVGKMESKVAAPLTLEELDIAWRIKSVLK